MLPKSPRYNNERPPKKFAITLPPLEAPRMRGHVISSRKHFISKGCSRDECHFISSLNKNRSDRIMRCRVCRRLIPTCETVYVDLWPSTILECNTPHRHVIRKMCVNHYAGVAPRLLRVYSKLASVTCRTTIPESNYSNLRFLHWIAGMQNLN